MSWGRLLATSCAVMVAATMAARADAIDGHWCFPDGRRISIQGPAIVTPGGSHIDGDYSRHFFRYVAPSSDPDPGQTIFMALVNEDTVHLRIGAMPSWSSDADTQVWHRCGPPTS
jgi:hypothetical protein